MEYRNFRGITKIWESLIVNVSAGRPALYPLSEDGMNGIE